VNTGPTRSGQWPRRSRLRSVSALAAAATALVMLTGCSVAAANAGDAAVPKPASRMNTATPIKHTVVIFGENISFDHYFGTYPNATNADGTPFHAAPNTPKVNGLTPNLLTNNPNSFNPKRLSPSQALTCDQDHGYKHEQQAFDNGAMDKFVQFTETDTCTGQPILFGEPGLVMDYYDGNTVTGMWNYAQNFALNDNSYGTTFGPSTPGALNLIAGQTHGATAVTSVTHQPVNDTSIVGTPDANHAGTIFDDADPAFDDCSDNNHTSTDNLVQMSGRNIGDLLNGRGVTWGWFEGGFRPTGSANGFAVCGASHANVGGLQQTDYSPHHEPFQYYQSTSNPKHLPPSSPAAIGQTDQANHQYDMTDFDTAVSSGNLPAVSFLKAPRYQDAHPANSDPLDEQQFVVDTINKLEKSPDWNSTAVVLAYDDSDGWYDHQASPIINGSADPNQDTTMCTAQVPRGGQQDRCGYGPRLPLMVISPFSRQNFVDHTVTDQSSVLKFIEDNWHLGELGGGSYDARAGLLNGMFDFADPHFQPVLLDPKTGAVTK
jgi:phospholipase C